MEIFRSALQFYARHEMQSIFVIKYIKTLATLAVKWWRCCILGGTRMLAVDLAREIHHEAIIHT